ncbi:hypothetical protein [Aeromicrobium chenweiae]|uniref:hypothetical protein n=1 Tax=Aeromicrobium chenweiae TaxID=2079793 RepID=UPI001092745D|nr:hypothetical protein [Aeromicrobium chenweiae]TGN32998.1 hypothetical protein E4L97_09990 [Aeromicrobium chenweiae]
MTAKKSDFYLEPSGLANALHLSAHGPNEKFPGHRFHLKVDGKRAAAARNRGSVFEYDVPRKGVAIKGREVADRVFLVARIRWMPSLKDARFKAIARSKETVPEIGAGMQGASLGAELPPDSAWDVDVFVSYERQRLVTDGPVVGDPVLGPLENSAGMHLMATSHHRSLDKAPSPEGLVPEVPEGSEDATTLLCGALDEPGEVYWLVETIVARSTLNSRT